MSDLTLAQLKKAYDAALEQIAAESFLAFGISPAVATSRLQAGNNPDTDPTTDDLPGKLRMTLGQAQTFVNRYDIIDAYQNDATGFSAVALRDTGGDADPTNDRVVIAVRSTEINNDTTRDVGTDLQIFTSGFAFDQILSAQDFLTRVQPQLQPGEKIDLVGYSLSGNVVRTMAAMYPDLINQSSGSNVVFNATGLGGFSDPTGQNRSRSVVLLEMMDLYRQVEADPNSATNVPVSLVPLQLAAIAAPTLDRTDPNGNVYPGPRNDFAEAYVQNRYTTFYNDFGTTVAEPSFAQYFGVALSGFDAAAVSNSGSHPVPVGVAIEGQPVVEIPGVASRFDYLNTHSLTLIADSLRLQVLLKEIDPNLSMDEIQTIFQASSARSANTLLGRAEKDTLENALDAVRKVLLPIDPIFQPTPSSDAAGGFGLNSNRTVFHTNITTVENVLSQVVSGTYRIESLVNRPLEEVEGNALLEDVGGKGLAYRYALKELNPFAIIGPTYAQHNTTGELDLYNVSTGAGTITTDYIQDRGLFLATKLSLNQSNLDLPLTPFGVPSYLTHYHDITTGYDIPSGLTVPPGIQREYIFGSDIAETIAGGSLFSNDHLYGGDGVDTLLGNAGIDYLQGDGGNDTLNGGSGADRMVGGQGNDTYIVDNVGDQVIEVGDNGSDTVESSVTFSLVGTTVEDLTLTGTSDINGTGNELDNLITGNGGINRLEGQGGTDHLIGGLGNDILSGGAGNNDLLEGGEGFDTYIYNAGDGTDQIEDSDASGQVIFQGQRLLGGLREADDSANTYHSLDGSTLYVLSGGHLVVNGLLTVNENFQSGQFGIELIDAPDTALQEMPTIDYGANGFPTETITLPNFGSWVMTRVGAVNYVVQGGQGTYWAETDLGNDQFYGGPGWDRFVAYAGNDRLEGFGGNDQLEGWEGDDVLLGGDGDDTLYGDIALAQAGQDYLDGGDGDDFMMGGSGDDILVGGLGNDTLLGEGGSTSIDYGPDPEFFPGFILDYSLGSGMDTLDGGAGNDTLVGFASDDILLGGDDTDVLVGDFNGGTFSTPWDPSQDGADYLNGGDGDDTLYGGGLDDILLGGAGNDILFGEGLAYGALAGDDWMDGGEGNDQLFGGLGEDTLSGGLGNDLLIGDFENEPGTDDTLDGGAGIDELQGGGGNDLLGGGTENDRLLGQDGDDYLFGDEGDDELQGGIGADALSGGAGTDVLLGQEDDDTLFGDEGDDELQGGDGIDLLGGDAGDDRLFGQADDDMLFGDEGNDALAGNDGNDSLFGGVGNDILEGGKGADVLVGGAGHDTYNFSLGDGQDTITDTALAGEGNAIQFFSGITLESLTFIQDQLQQTLTIQVAGGDSLRLLGFDPSTFSYVVDTLAFANGTVVTLADQLPLPGGLIEGTDESNNIHTGSTDDTIFAGAGNDFVNAGAGNDTLIGGMGNDVLNGSTGQDTYVFNAGDGMDIVSDGPGEGNRLVFGPGVSSNSVTLALGTEDSLAVRTGVAGDAIGILDSLEAGAPSIDSIEFADGTTLSIEALFSRGIEITGTAGADILTGTSLIDRISGGAGDDFIVGGLSADILHGDEGDDQVFGGDGDDQLDGGAGTDVLNGEAGQDTYVFGRGYGQDIVQDSPVEQSGPNTIQLTSGVSPDEVRLQARQSDDGINLVLTINGTQDELSLLGAADPSLLPISQVLFAGGTSWDTAELLTRIEGLRLTAAPAGSFLLGTGFRDELIGAQGDDELNGLGGADRMVGGAGDDRYGVDHPGDTVVELDGEGTDTVQSDVSWTLGANLENLTLLGTAAITGTGNTLANTLRGNSAANVLTGGAGSDTYVVEGDFNGFDTIYDVALPGEGNRLQFGNSFRPEDVLFIQEGSTLQITNGGGANGAILVDFDPSGATGSLVTEVVAFSGGFEDVTGGYETRLLALMNPTLGTDNGDAVTGTLQSDVIKAQGGDDVIEGGAGNDVLLGGTGNDTYMFNQGDGFDLLDDQPGTGDTNTVQFGAGITQEMLRVSYSGTSSIGALTVRVGTSGDGLYFLSVPSEDPTGPHAVDTFHFADGTQLTFAQLFEREVLVQGTTRSDGELFGTVADDRMLGLSGREALSSGDGNDTLIGGPGNDVLQGGGGSDTYVFNPGDGLDEILDDPGEQGSFDVNRLQFGTGITASDLALFEPGDGFTVSRIAIGTSGDGILLPNFIDFAPALTVAEFADGVILDLYQLFAANLRTDNQTITGGAGNPVLIGGKGNDTVLAGNDTTTLLGGAGHDTVIGGAAANLLMGGRGNDLLQGGDGHDTYLFNMGDGIDTIEDNAILGEGNRIQFGAGIGQSNLTFTHDQVARTLTIQVGSSGTDQLLLTNIDPTGVDGSMVVDTLAFADGSTANLADLFSSPVNHAPTVANPLADQTVPEDAPFNIGVPSTTFADEDVGDSLTLSARQADGTALPSWLSFNATTATFSGTPDDAQVGSFDLKVTATDPENLNISDVFTLTVSNVNEAPTVAAPLANQTALEDIAFTFNVPTSTFTDVDQVHGDTLTYSASLADGTALPIWLGFDPLTRTFSGTPGNTNVGSLALTVTAIDSGNLTASSGFTLAIQNVNDAPTVAVPLADQTGAEDSAFTFTVPATTFADEDLIHGDVLTYSAVLANGSALPTWLSFNPTTRTLSGTPGAGDAGTLQLAVTATDMGNLSATDTFALAISGPLPQTVVGTPADDVLTGGRGDDTLTGLVGNDTLTGGEGHDLLDGGTGTDTMQGGTGNDTYIVDVTSDVVTELVNEGTDAVQTSLLAYTLGANVENLTLTGTGPSAGFGTALSNVLIGNGGANLLDGRAGADTMSGGAGDDLYLVDHVGDTVVEQAGKGALDTVSSAVTYTLSANVEHLVLTGTAAINGTGNNGDNILTGNSAANVLTGRGGNDTYIIGNDDTVVETTNEGTDTVASGLTHTLTANVENLTLVGFSAINGTGNALDNVLNGLLNLAGNTLTGGAGNDTYMIGTGDIVVEAANGGTDTVQSSLPHTLGTNVENLILTGFSAVNGTGNSLNNTLFGNGGANTLSGLAGNDTLRGGLGNDTVNGGSGNDTFLFGLGEGQDLAQDNSGTADKLLYDAGINPLDLVISRQANDLRLSIHRSTDYVTVQNWYTSSVNRTETIQAGNGQTLLSTQVDQLIQAMAGFTQQTGLTWDQGIDQQPQEVQAFLAASWQP